LKPAAAWARPFDDPVLLPGGRAIVTLRDAGDYISSLPKAEQDLKEWQAAVEAMLLVVELNGPTMMRASAHESIEPEAVWGSLSPYGRQAAEWRVVRRVFGCRRDLRSCASLIMSTGDAYRRFLHDLHFNADWSFQIAVVRAPRPYRRYSNSRMASVPSLWMAI